MTTTELVTAVYLATEGKVPTFASGTTKWNKIVGLANNAIDVWQSEPDVDWYSLYSPKEPLGIITATDSFPIDETVNRISNEIEDAVTIVCLDGSTRYYEVVSPDRLYSTAYTNACAWIGDSLIFQKPFVSTDPAFGGSLYLPCYLYADKLVGDTDTVPVDNPQWLVMATAADYVHTDITKQNQYGDFLARTNDLMTAMKAKNDRHTTSTTRSWSPAGATW